MNNQEIMEKGQAYVMNTYGRFPVAIVRGQGAWVFDGDGRLYLDFTSGIAVCSLGHSPPELIEALAQQAQKLWHISNLYWMEPQVRLAEKLAHVSGLDRVFFCNSGAEAVEGAIKLARKYFFRCDEGQRKEIITFHQSFHGRTLAALTATGQKKHQEGFSPLLPGFAYAKFNDLASVVKLVSKETCAIMIEPIQGEGGIRPAEIDFLSKLRELCHREGLLMIFDEIQCGVGRTGDFLAWHGYGIRPDLLTLAKGLGGGFPIGALLATNEAAAGFEPGDHASTFGGNPLACAVAEKVVDLVAREEFLHKVQEKGYALWHRLQQIEDPRVLQIRGRGLMLGMEFDREVKDLIQICLDKGLLLVAAGPNVVRFVPPLNIEKDLLEQGMDIFRDAIQEWHA